MLLGKIGINKHGLKRNKQLLQNKLKKVLANKIVMNCKTLWIKSITSLIDANGTKNREDLRNSS